MTFLKCIPIRSADDPHTKASLLLQAHMSRLPLPITDYVTDTRSVLDNSARILQAIVDLSAETGWLDSTLSAMRFVQSLNQGLWYDSDPLLQIPHMDRMRIQKLNSKGVPSLKELLQQCTDSRCEVHRSTMQAEPKSTATAVLHSIFGVRREVQEAMAVLERLPQFTMCVASIVKKPSSEVSHRTGEGTNGTIDSSENQNSTDFWIVSIDMERVSGHARAGHGAPRAYAPRFPKVKDEGWWMIAANEHRNEVLALKRITCGKSARGKLMIPSRGSDGGIVSDIKIWLVSDCYLGLDERIAVALPSIITT